MIQMISGISIGVGIGAGLSSVLWKYFLFDPAYAKYRAERRNAIKMAKQVMVLLGSSSREFRRELRTSVTTIGKVQL